MNDRIPWIIDSPFQNSLWVKILVSLCQLSLVSKAQLIQCVNPPFWVHPVQGSRLGHVNQLIILIIYFLHSNSILIFCSLSFETWKFRISLLPSPAASKAHHHLCPRWDKTSPWAWLLPSPGHVLKSSSNLTHYWDLSVLKQIQNIQNILIHSNNREQVKQQQANHAKTCWKQSEEFALRKITRISEFELLRTWLSLAVLHMKARSVSLD